jgi:hypothetical protein
VALAAAVEKTPTFLLMLGEPLAGHAERTRGDLPARD